EKIFVIPPHRTRYLSEISENNRSYDRWTDEQKDIAQKMYALHLSIDAVKESAAEDGADALRVFQEHYSKLSLHLDPQNWKLLQEWPEKVKKYREPVFKFKVRDKEIGIQTHAESLSHLQIPKVALPKYDAWGDLLKWNLQENVPGEFPYTAGIYPFKREGEDP